MKYTCANAAKQQTEFNNTVKNTNKTARGKKNGGEHTQEVATATTEDPMLSKIDTLVSEWFGNWTKFYELADSDEYADINEVDNRRIDQVIALIEQYIEETTDWDSPEVEDLTLMDVLDDFLMEKVAKERKSSPKVKKTTAKVAKATSRKAAAPTKSAKADSATPSPKVKKTTKTASPKVTKTATPSESITLTKTQLEELIAKAVSDALASTTPATSPKVKAAEKVAKATSRKSTPTKSAKADSPKASPKVKGQRVKATDEVSWCAARWNDIYSTLSNCVAKVGAPLYGNTKSNFSLALSQLKALNPTDCPLFTLHEKQYAASLLNGFELGGKTAKRLYSDGCRKAIVARIAKDLQLEELVDNADPKQKNTFSESVVNAHRVALATAKKTAKPTAKAVEPVAKASASASTRKAKGTAAKAATTKKVTASAKAETETKKVAAKAARTRKTAKNA